MRWLSLIILLLAACAAAPVAHAADPERIIVTNARLVGRDAASQDAAINYRNISLDRAGVQGNSSGLNARIQLMLD